MNSDPEGPCFVLELCLYPCPQDNNPELNKRDEDDEALRGSA